MRPADAQRLEAAIAYVAATSFAGSVGFAVFQAAGLLAEFSLQAAVAGLSALGAYHIGFLLLSALEGRPRPFPQAQFQVVEFQPAAAPCAEELVLTDDDRLDAVRSEEALVLEDVLVEMPPNSRVVQLFDAAAMPKAGQPQPRTGQRLVGGANLPRSPDASEALFAALADLRRSLR